MKHTSEPWKLILDEKVAVIELANGEELESVFIRSRPKEMAIANRIVHCVNTHDEMLEALEFVSMNIGLGEGQINPKFVELQKIMKAAIAKARGES